MMANRQAARGDPKERGSAMIRTDDRPVIRSVNEGECRTTQILCPIRGLPKFAGEIVPTNLGRPRMTAEHRGNGMAPRRILTMAVRVTSLCCLLLLNLGGCIEVDQGTVVVKRQKAKTQAESTRPAASDSKSNRDGDQNDPELDRELAQLDEFIQSVGGEATTADLKSSADFARALAFQAPPGR